MQRAGVTPTSTDPYVSTVFATHGEKFGNGVVYIASSSDLEGVSMTASNTLAAIEREAVFEILPSDFANRASMQVSSSQARTILADMGYGMPSNIPRDQISSILEDWMGLSNDEIIDFVRRAGGK